jgi:hypothetical protein
MPRIIPDLSHVRQQVVRNRGRNGVVPTPLLQPLVNNFTQPEPPAAAPVVASNPYEDRVTTPPQPIQHVAVHTNPRNRRRRIVPVLGGKKESKRRIKSA